MRKNIFKRFSIQILVLLLLAVTFGSCSKDDEPAENEYYVNFYSVDNNREYKDGNIPVNFVCGGMCKGNQKIISGSHQWFDNWVITVSDKDGNLIEKDIFDLSGKVVFIKLDAYALGDSIAWIPYVEEFRKKNNCIMLCSTFHNDLFKDLYSNILFVPPNTNIDNVYAQYYIGAQNENQIKYSNTISDEHPLQATAYNNLGLEPKEIRPQLENLLSRKKYGKKYVCISEYASSEIKHWKAIDGWQKVVDFIVEKGYDVVVISKEQTSLKNVINLTGDANILNRAQTLLDAEFFIGVSSGLSWLSWSVGTHVVMISDVTPINHEFQSNITRMCANPEIKKVDYNAPKITDLNSVLEKINSLL
jgi:autotransporter strand-loop-strand O-heptosyltransferase